MAGETSPNFGKRFFDFLPIKHFKILSTIRQVHGVGELRSRGQVLLVRLSTTSSSRRQCDGGGGSGLFSLCNSSYSLWCPLWPLASGLWPLASGQRRLISGTCSYYWRRRIQIGISGFPAAIPDIVILYRWESQGFTAPVLRDSLTASIPS